MLSFAILDVKLNGLALGRGKDNKALGLQFLPFQAREKNSNPSPQMLKIPGTPKATGELW